MKIKLIKLTSVKSTNDIAIKLIKTKNLKKGIVVSKKQTKGRGTMGKKWISSDGNLFLSVFFDVTFSKIKAEKFSVLNPFIIKNVLKKYSKYKISIKWPNDLLIKKQKVSGILQEVINYKDKSFLIIGVGINTKTSPKNKKFRSISLFKCSKLKVKNHQILKEIKEKYEKVIFYSKKRNFDYIKKAINRI